MLNIKTLGFGVLIALTFGCSVIGGSNGKAACTQLKEATVAARGGNLSAEEYRDRLEGIGNKAADAEEENIRLAGLFLRNSVTGTLDIRSFEQASLTLLADACIESGYLKPDEL